MSPNLLALYVALSADNAVLHAVRSGKAQTLVALQASAESPELSKGQSFGVFTPNETEQAFIDLVAPKVSAKVDPMVNRLKKSEIVKPVQFVLQYVMANPTMTRKDLIADLVNLGVATYTARTQVQVGLKRVKLLQELARKVAAEAAEAETEEQDESQEG